MNRRMTQSMLILLIGAMTVLPLAGCRDSPPHSLTLGPGYIGRHHAKPIGDGYYSNWDPYAATIEVVPMNDVNPVGTQHMLIATIKDKDGEVLPTRRVEWTIPDGSVGAIVEVDESGIRDTRGHKVTSKFAITHTNIDDHVLTLGNDDPSDDIHLKRGQTWCVITSPVEGTTHVIAAAPGIYNWAKHKVMVKKHWFDVAWRLPADATNRTGTDHPMQTNVMKHSDAAPLGGYQVYYKVLSGPDAVFASSGQNTAMVVTSDSGKADVVLKQVTPVAGVNEIEITIVRPKDEKCCRPEAIIHKGVVTKTWIPPAQLSLTNTVGSPIIICDEVIYTLVVRNDGGSAATNVKIVDQFPQGMEMIDGKQTAEVEIGTLNPGEERTVTIRARAKERGTFTNDATATADDGLTAQASSSTNIVSPTLRVAKSGPGLRYIGKNIKYAITVSNEGDAVAKNVVLIDTIPAGASFIQASDAGAASAGKVTWMLGDLQPGQSRTVDLTLTSARAGELSSQSIATAYCAEAKDQTITQVAGIPGILLECIDVEDPIEIGETDTYIINVKNQGSKDGTNIVVTCTLPAEQQFVSASGPTKEIVDGQTISFEPLPSLSPKQIATYKVMVKGVEPGDVRFKVTMKSDQLTQVVQETEATNIYK